MESSKNHWQIADYTVVVSLFLVVASAVFVFWYKLINTPEEAGRLCKEEEIIYGDWSQCNGEYIERSLHSTVDCVVPSSIELRKPCSITNRVYLFKEDVKEYTTQIDNEEQNTYKPNFDNLTILPTGTFSGATLTLRIETTVKDGSPYKIPEYYYVFFDVNEDFPRVIGTKRSKDNRLDTKAYGVFQGTETPKELTFDLKAVEMANVSTEGNGSSVEDYVDRLNGLNGNEINVSLFVADGRSMTEPDELKRIFGTITEAYIDYSCSESPCSIERVPALPLSE